MKGKNASRTLGLSMISLLGLLSMVLYQNFNVMSGPSVVPWGEVILDFNDSNSVTTRPLDQLGPAPTLSEPLFARLTGETGPLHVAKGRAFYSTQAGNNPPITIGSTIAPATQYAFGIESSCDVANEPDRCLRDNSFFVRLNPNARDPQIDNSIQDKAFFRFIHVDHLNPLSLSVDAPVTRYLSFDMKFDRFYERSRSWTMIMQAFQEGLGGGPALTIEVLRSSDPKTPLVQQDLELQLFAFTNADPTVSFITASSAGAQASHPIKKRDACSQSQLKVSRERWYNFAMVMRPEIGLDASTGEERGLAVLYIDGKELCRFKGNWGYLPVDPTKPLARMGIDLGLYRARTSSSQMVHIDNVNYGPSLHSVWTSGVSRVKFPLPSIPIQ